MTPALVITSGEPAGIGPDLCALLALEAPANGVRPVVLGDRDLLVERAATHGIAAAALMAAIEIEHIPVFAAVTPGVLDPANSPYVLALLDRAIDGCRSGRYAAMVTAPLHKGVINDAQIAGLGKFMGHTEYLAERTGTPQVVMMLVGGSPMLRVALATTHIALKDVPSAITRDGLRTSLRILESELREKFGFAAPRILVAGLNPHAGESGHLGDEEINVIAPVVEELRGEGMRLSGPLPADTLFTPQHLQHADAVLAMYHDQGLAVLKFASFGEGVNITLGLPLIRTSVDHGTALDLAGKPGIDRGSMTAAIALATRLAKPRAH
jgi:4-hydroxythreonine-4-phosphate dehydrogenase